MISIWVFLAPIFAFTGSIAAIKIGEVFLPGFHELSVFGKDGTIILMSIVTALAVSAVHANEVRELGLFVYLYIVLISGGVAGLTWAYYLKDK